MPKQVLAEQRARERSNRPTVGLLTYAGGDPASQDLWAGVDAAARDLGLNSIVFPGEALRSPLGFLAQANVLYDLVSAERVAGLVIWGGVLAHHVGREELLAFYQRYQPLPIVSISLPLPGIPTLLFDNYRGMYAAVEHLIVEHGYRQIAFIRGPEGHPEAEERYRAYREALATHGLPFDSALVQPGSFDKGAGDVAVRHLLADGTKFEAVVAVNDQAAMDAMTYLRAEGLRVPSDVAVVGFDNRPEANFSSPPLTTVAQSWRTLGRRAVELLSDAFQGRELPERLVLPTQLVVRQSCGCLSSSARQASWASVASTRSIVSEVPEDLLAAMQAVPNIVDNQFLPTNWSEKLLQSFMTELAGQAPGGFDQALRGMLSQAATTEELLQWQNLLAIMRGYLLPSLKVEECQRAETLWQQSQLVIGEHLYRQQASQYLQLQQQENHLNAVSQRLLNAADLPALLTLIVQEGDTLDVQRCYLSLYEHPETPSARAKLLLAYDEDGRKDLLSEESRFPTALLAPEGVLPSYYHLVVTPLYFRKEQLGFALLELRPSQGEVQQRLQNYLSSALKNVLYLERLERRATRIQTASEVAGAVSTILEQETLIQRVVELIQERFELYYVGLFLVERTGERLGERKQWAVLRAGTGEAGEKMLSLAHRLEVGGDSMIGWSVAHQEARIALDVGQEPVRFDNPLLPLTRSEMALPLLSRGQTIGALTIQSTAAAAFNAEDINILQTMATQVAIAIENAQLFKEAQLALSEMQAIQRRYVQQSWQQQLESTPASTYTVARPGMTPRDDENWQRILQTLSRERVTTAVDKGPDGESRSLLSAPLTIRGEVIGNLLLLDDDGERRWSETEQELVSAVTERMAQIAESLRLLDETQRQATQERFMSEVMTRARETLDVKMVLQTAADNLYRTLDLEEVVIQLVEDI
ncbi:MAG: substrate-binding domain-containing protein [Chloroflexota bacterium]|nr:substrate-binding domain-containing protein [Chloroflexota bacterium]